MIGSLQKQLHPQSQFYDKTNLFSNNRPLISWSVNYAIQQISGFMPYNIIFLSEC